MNERKVDHRWTVLGFVLFMFAIAFMGVYKSEQTLAGLEKVKKVATGDTLDSIIGKRIDARFTSYDAEFVLSNLVVVNKKGKVIGKVLLYTNSEDLEEFYDNPQFRETPTYMKVSEQLEKGGGKCLIIKSEE